MSTRIGYVLRMGRDRYENMESPPPTEDLQKARVYDTSTRVPVRVTEEPGPPIREVVELRGTVDLDGLKFAIEMTATSMKTIGPFITVRTYIANTGTGWGTLESATIWNRVEGASVEWAKRGLGVGGMYRIVGIREIPGPTVRKVEEITPDMLK